jgi:hypothetical protein
MKAIIQNPVVDFLAFCAFFIGFGLLARVVPWLQWAYVGFNALIFLAVLFGVFVAIYNTIKNPPPPAPFAPTSPAPVKPVATAISTPTVT